MFQDNVFILRAHTDREGKTLRGGSWEQLREALKKRGGEKSTLQNRRMEGGPENSVSEFYSGQVNLSQDSNLPEGKKAGHTEASSGIEYKGLL